MLILSVPLLTCACFYGSEFLDGDELRELADGCGIKGYQITREDNVDYLDLPSGLADPAGAKTCVEKAAGQRGMALVRLDDEAKL